MKVDIYLARCRSKIIKSRPRLKEIYAPQIHRVSIIIPSIAVSTHKLFISTQVHPLYQSFFRFEILTNCTFMQRKIPRAQCKYEAITKAFSSGIDSALKASYAGTTESNTE